MNAPATFQKGHFRNSPRKGFAYIRSALARCRHLDNNSDSRNKKRRVFKVLSSSSFQLNTGSRTIRSNAPDLQRVYYLYNWCLSIISKLKYHECYLDVETNETLTKAKLENGFYSIINGERIPAGKTFSLVNPATGEQLAIVPDVNR